MIQMNLAVINTFQLEVISHFKKFKNLKCNYDIKEDLMNTNETDKTFSLISRNNSDNLKRFSLFSFLQQRAFIFITKTTFTCDL